jgi:hypothetical protein
MKRPLTTLDLRAKKATRDLQKAVGGVHDAGKITGKSHAMHGYYQSRGRSDSITIADVLRLEAVTVRSPNTLRSRACFVRMRAGSLSNCPTSMRMTAI